VKKLILALCVGLAACTQMSASGEKQDSSASSGEASQKARAFTDLAGAYFTRGQYKVALDELRKAIQADPHFGPAYNIYGMVYMELAEDRLAEENFRKAIDLDRDDSEAHNNFGWFLCTRGRYDEGQEQFAAALRNPLYPRPEQALLNAGLCAEKQGDIALAEAKLTRTLKLQPDNANAILKLAGLQYRQGRFADAQRLLTRYGEVAQPSAESLWLSVRVERKLGDRAQEAAYGLQLRKHFPDSNEARLLTTGQYE